MTGFEHDLLIVGGGLAGLSAAATAAENGVCAVVMEQGENDLYACNSRYAGGMMHLAFLDMGLAPEVLSPQLRGKRTGGIDTELLDVIAKHSRETLDWLICRAGARFIRAGAEPWQKWCLAPIRPRRSGLVWEGRGPDKVLRGLEVYLTRLGGRLMRGRRVMSIHRMDDGRYAVDICVGGQTEVHVARAIVLSDGGFQNNAKLIQEKIAPDVDRVLSRNAGTSAGFSYELAQKIGLKTSAVDRFYGHIVSSLALADTRLWPWPTLDELALAGMLVDSSGKNIGSRLSNGVAMANAIAASAKGNGCFVVIDDKIWQRIGSKTRVVPCNPFLERLAAPIHQGDSVAEAAGKAGLDIATILEEVEAHNDRASGGGTIKRHLGTAPFRVIPVVAGLTYTMSGLEIGADCCVRQQNDSPMPGLYAAGSTVGELEGGEDTFYLGGLAKAAILGRLAGRAAAEQLIWRESSTLKVPVYLSDYPQS